MAERIPVGSLSRASGFHFEFLLFTFEISRLLFRDKRALSGSGASDTNGSWLYNGMNRTLPGQEYIADVVMAGNRNPDRSIFHHLSKLFVYSGLVLIFVTLVISGYERYTQRSRIAQSLTGITHIVEALQIYSIENPHSDIHPLRKAKRSAGIFLSPVHNQKQHYAFLTTPHPYLERIPIDPFMLSIEKTDPHPVSLHWVRVKQHAVDDYEHSHIAWGAFSVGPALALPDHYQIDYLQNVPLRAKPLRQIFFSPSNGLASYGILYKDSLGNYTDIVE